MNGLEYDEEDDISRAQAVYALSRIVNMIFENEEWEGVKEAVCDKLSEFNFTDLMLFRQSSGDYYIFTREGFDELLLDIIPTLSVEEMYYYLKMMDDNGDGNTPKIVEAKKKRMNELKCGLFYDLAEGQKNWDEEVEGLKKITMLNNLKRRINSKMPYYIDHKHNDEIVVNEYDRRAVGLEEYHTYINYLENLSSSEIIKLLCVQLATKEARIIYKREAKILNEKLKDASKIALLCIYASAAAAYNKDIHKSFVLENQRLMGIFWSKGFFTGGTHIIPLSEEELNLGLGIAGAYRDMAFRNSIKISLHNLESVIIQNEDDISEEGIQEQYLQNYLTAKDGIESDLSFIGNCVGLDKCKDIQLINIINNLNRKGRDLHDRNETAIEAGQKNYLVKYLKGRIIYMNPLVASMLEVHEDGVFNHCIEAAIEQPKMIVNRNQRCPTETENLDCNLK